LYSKIELSDGQLCQEYSHQKLISDNPPSRYIIVNILIITHKYCADIGLQTKSV